MARRICDLKLEEITIGMKVRSLRDPEYIGVIVKIDTSDDDYAWVKWPKDDKAYSGFYGNNCRCELVE